MRILVCGGRNFDDWCLLKRTLNQYGGSVITIIQGGAKGADFLARVYAKYYDQPMEEYPADWGKYKQAAGGIRNQQMLDEGKPDLVVAFPGGNGTADMIRRAEKAGVKVVKVDS